MTTPIAEGTQRGRAPDTATAKEAAAEPGAATARLRLPVGSATRFLSVVARAAKRATS